MSKSLLNQIEDARMRNFSVKEIQNLLAGSEYDHDSDFAKFCEQNTFLLKRKYGRPDFQMLFRRDLAKRLKQIEELVYLKRIEETLTRKVDIRLKDIKEETRMAIEKAFSTTYQDLQRMSEEEFQEFNSEAFQKELHTILGEDADFRMQIFRTLNAHKTSDELELGDERLMTFQEAENFYQEEFRKQISGILQHDSPLTLKGLSQLRGTNTLAGFDGMHIQVNEEYIQNYRELIRYELEQQLQSVGKLKDHAEQHEQEEKHRDIYNQATFLVDFLVTHIDQLHGSKQYLKAFLLKKMRSENGAAFIEELYQELQESVLSDDGDNCKQSIQALADRLKEAANSEKKGHLRDLVAVHAPQLNLSAHELNSILKPRKRIIKGEEVVTYMAARHGGTYHERIGHHLEELETIASDIALSAMLEGNDPARGDMAYHMNRREEEIRAFRKTIQEFKDEYYTVDFLIDSHFQGLGDIKKKQLKSAMSALSTVRGIEQHDHQDLSDNYQQLKNALVIPLLNAAESNTPDQLIEKAAQEVEQYLIKQGTPESHLERLKRQDRNFDVFTYMRTLTSDEYRFPNEPFSRGTSEQAFYEEIDGLSYFSSLRHAKSTIRMLAYAGDLMTPMGPTERPFEEYDTTQLESLKQIILYGHRPSDDEPGLLEEEPSLSPDEQAEALAFIKYYQDILERGTDLEFFSSLEECLETISILGAAHAFDEHVLIDVEKDIYEHERESRPLLAAIDASGFSAHQKQQALDKLEEFMKGEGEEYQFAEHASIEESDTDPFLKDEEVLYQIRWQLSKMEAICQRNFSKPNDTIEYDKARREIADEMKIHRYLADEVTRDELGKEVLYNGQPVYKKVWKEKELPILEKDRLNALEHERSLVKRYGHLHELRGQKIFREGRSIERPDQVSEALVALFGGEFGIERSKRELKLLTKVMTLDHPLTAIRFHCADKKPFLYREKVQIHRIPGEGRPATYFDRAKYLLSEAQKHIEDGNYGALSALFEDGAVGHRLFVDASFCPVKKLKDPSVFQELFKDEFREDHVETVLDKQRFPSRDFDYFRDELEAFEQKAEWKHFFDDFSIQGASLMDDPQYFGVFAAPTDTAEIIAQHQDALVFNEDGTLNPELTREAINALVDHVQAGGSVESLGLTGSANIPAEKLEAIAKDYPLIAGRMAQMNSLLGGGAAGAAQIAARYGLDSARLVPESTLAIMKMYWKSIGFWTPLSIWVAIDQMVEHISGLADFNTKTAAYDLLQKVFDGTLVGNEFAKLYQSQEDKRVSEFKDAFSDFGHQDVIDRLYTAADVFELKAAFMEGFENRGIITNQDLLDHRLIKNLNRYTSSVTIPTNYSKEEMDGDEEVSFKVLDKMREAIDDIWGEGTWQAWRSAGASKYESERETASKNFEGNSVREKEKWYSYYWDLLKSESGRRKIGTMHPAEIVGNIEQDMMQGDRDVGETFAIMAAMIALGFVKLDHVRRLQTAHSNNLPIHALLEPEQSDVAGLTDFIIKSLDKGQPYKQGQNDVIDFFQGKKAVKLKATRHKGKWRFPTTHKDAKTKKMEDVVITVHQLQKNREAQPEWHRKMDNCCIGIFTPCYSWNQIEGAMSPNTQGLIEARSHDMIAAYRGIHSEFAAYMEAMGDTELMSDELTFKRQVWHAYEALCKTQAFAAFFGRHRERAGKNVDFVMNTMDGSPNFSSEHKEIRMQGKTNYESLILGTDGPHQRMAESSDHLDNTEEIDDELRYKFKQMAGFQYVKELGLNKDTGKEDPESYEPYDYKTFNPSERWKEVMPLFIENVKRLASKHGFGESIANSLNESQMGNIDTTNPGANTARQMALRSWMNGDALL